IADAGGFAYLLQVTGAGYVEGSRLGGGLTFQADGSAVDDVTSLYGKDPVYQKIFQSIQKIGTLGTLQDAVGQISAHLEVVDNGGARRCVDRTFFFDGLVEGPAVSLGRDLFSPNGDGALDTATVTFQAAEPANVDVQVYPAQRTNSAFSPP